MGTKMKLLIFGNSSIHLTKIHLKVKMNFFLRVPTTGLAMLLLTNFLMAQNQLKVDSMQVGIRNSTIDTVKLSLYRDLSDYYYQFDYDSALKDAQIGYDLAVQAKNDFWQAIFSVQKGKIYFEIGDYSSSLNFFFAGERYFSTHSKKYQKELLSIYNNCGALYDRLGDYTQALENYFKALHILNNFPTPLDKKISRISSIMFNNIGNIYNSQGNNTTAIEYYNKGLEIAEANNDNIAIGLINNNLGKLNLNEFNDLKKARYYLGKSLEARLKADDKKGLAKSYYFLCSYYILANELDSAEAAATKSLEIAQELGSLESQLYAKLLLAEIYEKTHNYQLALYAHKEFKQLSDSVINTDKLNEISRLQKEFELEKFDKQALIEKQKLSSKYNVLISTLALFLLAISFLFFKQRIRKRKIELENVKLELDIDTKNRELTTDVMYLVRKNELINNVAKRLMILHQKLLPEYQKPIMDIINELEKEVGNEVWQEFEYRFQQVHSQFYQNLRNKHPDLSPAEERLCAFLRLNMSSKEIVAITHQNIKSVEVSRTRLRKKLELTNTDTNLVSYLLSL